MNSAPASIFESSPLGRQPAGGSTGSSAAPSTNFTAPLISVPEGSRCSERICCAVASKAVVFRSKTGLVGLVAELRVVAAHRENIAYAERRGAEQLGLQRNAVPVATGDLQNGLDAASHQEVRRRETRHVRSRSRAVGHIDRCDEPAQRERVVE